MFVKDKTSVLINLITKIEPKIFLTYVATLMFLFKLDLMIRLAIMKRHSGFIKCTIARCGFK